MNCLHLNSEQDTWRESCVFIPKYSWTPLIRTQLFQILCYFKFKTISLGFALQSSTIDYFKLLLFRTFFFVSPKSLQQQDSTVFIAAKMTLLMNVWNLNSFGCSPCLGWTIFEFPKLAINGRRQNNKLILIQISEWKNQ